jgi:hypothetical protein
MKNIKLGFKKIFKWSIIGIVTYWILSTFIFGHTKFDSDKGEIIYGWSGFDAIFTDEDFGFSINKESKSKLDGVDGPYVFDKIKFTVNSENKLVQNKINRNKPLKVIVNNKNKDEFNLILKKVHPQEIDNYDFPSKLISISDIEGNFNAFYSFLLNNKVIDKNYNWTYNNGHLVLNGDFFDRGENVNQVLWLIYMLEEKAEEQGGKVHFINGNHEIMNLYGDVSYAKEKYIEVAKQISNEKHWDTASKFLHSNDSELGKWLRSKNVIEKIGPYIFVHGGINTKLMHEKLSISEINKIAIKYYGKRKLGSENIKENLVLSPYFGPYWDRSLSMDFIYKMGFFFNDPLNAPTHKPSQTELDAILKFYNSRKIIIGHSVVNEVTYDYNKKVIKIDVKHGLTKNNKNTQGLLIENGIEYLVNGLGIKMKL